MAPSQLLFAALDTSSNPVKELFLKSLFLNFVKKPLNDIAQQPIFLTAKCTCVFQQLHS